MCRPTSSTAVLSRKCIGTIRPTGKLDARRKWLSQIDIYRKEWDKFVAPGFSDDTTPVNPQRAALEIDKALPADAILVSDIGVHHNWLLGFCKPLQPCTLVGSLGFGTMWV